MAIRRRGIAPILVTVLLLALTLSVAFGESLLDAAQFKQGSLVPMTYATEEGLTKEVGDVVNFKVKVKNTGNTETGYIVIVKWSLHGEGEWETACVEDIWLAPDQYEHLEMGCLEITEDWRETTTTSSSCCTSTRRSSSSTRRRWRRRGTSRNT